MKFNAFILSIIFGFFSLASKAQSINSNSIKKGYYSIGRNSEKLNFVATPQIPRLFSFNSMHKGYYATKKNKNTQQWVYTLDANGAVSEPIKKGYFSIGKNAEKVKQ